MPTYETPVHGVAMTWERLEAAFVAPLERVQLNALELYHIDSGQHRFVADHADMMATLEADAPVIDGVVLAGAGTEVEWIGAPLTINWPGQSDTAKTEFSVSLDGVAGLMDIELVKTRESLSAWYLIGRVYSSDDTSGPAQLPPTVLMLSSIKTVGAAILITADLSDSFNINVPALTFKRSEYPGLLR